ncbi:hypothetical protein [Desulfosediminicola flagellatus]|uniref:hypothetical protein n=1 Tax=Desulfosediminicola flagellatus TaxID=2569541 RepID=UPI0010ABDAFF|nr:hypothetical protein [Desulfosediminicola flagellatus]
MLYPLSIMAKGYMGGRGDVVVAEEPADTGDDGGDGGVPDTVDGPNNDNMSDAGKLFGDLYVILRQMGGAEDKKLVPNEDGSLVVSSTVVGGEPVLTVVDPPTNGTDGEIFVDVNKLDYGWYAAEIGEDANENPIYEVQQSDYPALCVQPVASYERWGNINDETGLTKNRLPLVITYDATWGRSECEVGQINGPVTVNQNDGELTIPINEYFVEPCEKNTDGTVEVTEKCQWTDPKNGLVTYPDGVLWTELIGEVHFGRLNLSRSPEAVLQAAFDEAINTINSDDTIAIEIDASGRLLMTKNVYDEFLVDPDTGTPLPVTDLDGNPITVKKAIDSPLENLALYVKLMQDGHLVTPGDERAPIDRSKNGGIPLWKLLELEDGPADAVLRPTIDIAKMKNWGLGDLVVTTPLPPYYTYYDCTNINGTEVDCMEWDPDPTQPEIAGEWVANPDAIDRILLTTTTPETDCPQVIDSNGEFMEYACEGPFTGIETDFSDPKTSEDFKFAAAFLAAAADKTGHITVDMVVYLNSILGINKVLGFSEYEVDGTPTDGAIDYSVSPVYFNFEGVVNENRGTIFSMRGEVLKEGGKPDQASSTYTGSVNVLQISSDNWTETTVGIAGAQMNGTTIFDNINLMSVNADGSLVYDEATTNILGFTQHADDDLSVIEFIHTYQIPERR